MAKRYAVVDIGSNSIRLMIAEAGPEGVRSVYKSLNTVRIGEGMGRSEKIAPAAMARALKALEDYREEARAMGAQAFCVFATSAVREAENKDAFVRAVKESLGVDVEIVSGREEARIGFLGAAGRDRPCGVVDIGGGSTEVVCGKGEEPAFAESFKVGTVRALTLFPRADDNKDYGAVRGWVRAKIACLTDARALRDAPLIGIGGTATALASIALGLQAYDGGKVQGYVLRKEKLDEIFAALSPLNVEQRKHVTGLDAMRADVIVFGCVILQGFLAVIGRDEIEVSDRDNQEGYLIRKLGL